MSTCFRRGLDRCWVALVVLCAVAALAAVDRVAAADPPKPAAEAAKPPAAKPDKDGWTSLFDGKTLSGWEPAKFGGEGKVTLENGTIVMDRGDMMTGIKYAGKPIKMNYELTLEGKRLDGNDFFCTTTFPVGESFCSFVVGGWGGSVVGLSCIDFNDAANNSTMRTMSFKKDQWYSIRVRVTKDKIECWIDKEKLVDTTTRGHKVSTRWECDACKPLGVATYSTKGAIRNLKVRAVAEPDTKPELEDEP